MSTDNNVERNGDNSAVYRVSRSIVHKYAISEYVVMNFNPVCTGSQVGLV
jgi:hypothetical protein